MAVSVYYQNVRGLRTKTSTFYRNLCLNAYDVVCLTETWLLEGVNNSELFDDRYIVWRRDRDYNKTRQSLGGGILIAFRRELAAELRNEWCSSAEDLWVTLTLQHRKPKVKYKLHLCTVYICNQGTLNSLSTQLATYSERMADIILDNPCDKFIIIGDFNMPNLLWKYCSDTSTYICENLQGSSQFNLFDNVSLCNLSQYNFIKNSNNRILDLIFSNSKVSVTMCHSPLVPEDSYHPALTLSADFVQLHTLKSQPYTKFLYHSGDYEAIMSKIDCIDWNSELYSRPMEEAVSFFYKLLDNLRLNYIPTKLVTPSMQKYPSWYKKPLIKLLKEKYKYHVKYKIYGNLSDLQSFTLLRDRAKSLENDMFSKYILSIEANISTNPKAFWSFIKTKNQANSYPAVLKFGQKASERGEDICNLFSDYFHSTFLDNTHIQYSLQDTASCSTTSDIGDIEVDVKEVYGLLKSLDLNKSAGPDNIPAIFIVSCAKSLAIPLSILFRRSFSEGVVPSIWKSVYVTPIHKTGPKDMVENYRPISKLCLFAKVLEKIVHKQLFASVKNALSSQQHGFIRGRSTTSNLLLCSDFLTHHMSEPSQVDVVYTDYSKCFDRIDHLMLLSKLQSIGIRGNLYRWFTSYVNNRCQTVALNGYTSRAMRIPSGVPQGSLLGPLLFNIFVNDIATCFLYSNILLYADDMKILCPIKSLQCAQHLQEDLCRFENYCIVNKLDLNVSKCYVCTYTRKPSCISFSYTLKNLNINRVNSIRDLGVTFDSKLLFDEHINKIINKASKALGFILRMSVDFNSIKTLKILYCAYVRSNLEYASQVWNPVYDIYSTRIEGIQKRFLRYLQFRIKTYLSGYVNRCRKFHMLPLYERRHIADLVYLLKIANGSVDCPELLNRIGIRVPFASLRRPCDLYVPGGRTNYRKNSYLIRVSSSFNKLCKDCDVDLFNTSAGQLKQLLANKFFGN